MKLSEYQELSKRTMPPSYSIAGKELYTKDSKVNYVMGLSGETGELIDLLKKEWFHGHKFSDDEKKKELGDIFHYLFGLCTMLGYSVEEITSLNLMKLGKRYPNGFSVEDSIKRVDVE